MKYTPQLYQWTALLRAKVVLTEKFIEKLEGFDFHGNERRVFCRINGVDFQVFGPEKVVPGKEVDILFEKRNDGRRRISILTDEPRGMEMELKTATEQILRFVGACEDEFSRYVTEIFGAENES